VACSWCIELQYQPCCAGGICSPIVHTKQVLDPSLGQELNEREYGGDCRLYIPGQGWNLDTLKATLFDEFVIAHTLGWWAKALIMRNWCGATLCVS
jgi:hypothetical protein